MVGPSVRTHRVRLTQEGELVYLSGGGWAEFVAAYDLQLGWFLTFTPHSDLTYTVIVMDHTSTDRDYPLATPTPGYPVASHVIGQSNHYFVSKFLFLGYCINYDVYLTNMLYTCKTCRGYPTRT